MKACHDSHIISGSKKIASTSLSCSFLCLQVTAEINKIEKRTQCDLYVTSNDLSKYFNILVPCLRDETLLLTKKI